MTFNNIEQLMAAYDGGYLDRDEDILFIDNDVCFIYKDGKLAFSISPGDLLCQLLELVRIPAEGV